MSWFQYFLFWTPKLFSSVVGTIEATKIGKLYFIWESKVIRPWIRLLNNKLSLD